MERERFEGICEVATEGKIKWVDNLETHEAGRVVSCDDRWFEVEPQGQEGHHEKWDRKVCKERTYGYKPMYGKYTKH